MKLWVGLLVLMSVLIVGCDPEFYSYNATNTTGTEENFTMSMSEDNESMTTDDSEMMSEDDAKGTSDATDEEDPQVSDDSDFTPVVTTGPIDATFVEGDYVALKDTLADDPDGDNLQYTFTAPLSEDGEWQTKVGDEGVYEIILTASDGKLISTRTLRIEVLPLNNEPIISNFNDVTVKEGQMVKFSPVFTDEDGDKLTFSFNGWMSEGAYRTNFQDAGEHTVTLSVSDGAATTEKTVVVTVLDVNREPEVTRLNPREGIEGDLIAVSVEAEDPDNDTITVTYGAPLDEEEGTWRTKVGDEGVYEIPVYISDGVNTVEEFAKVTIFPANKPPVISNFEDLTVTEGDLIKLNPKVEDPEGKTVNLIYSGWMNSNTRQTNYNDEGEYTVRLTVDDGAVVSVETITITVLNNNRAPVFREDLFE